jgi:hypothetical protein
MTDAYQNRIATAVPRLRYGASWSASFTIAAGLNVLTLAYRPTLLWLKRALADFPAERPI